MNKSSVLRSILVVTSTLFLFASCDKDFNEIDSDVIGNDHFELLPDNLTCAVAFNQATGAVQTNNMAINSLGIYNNPVFGKTKAHFVTDIQMAVPNPSFKPEMFVELDSVVLTVPYFSTKLETATNGRGKYKLDSLYGAGFVDLKVFESGVVLNNFTPPAFQEGAKYYSSEKDRFTNNKIGNHLNNSLNASENTEFEPNPKEVETYKRDKGLVAKKAIENVEARLTPRMRLHLNTVFFKNKIINAPAGKLINNSIFKEYFRGLYFEVTDVQTGTLTRMKFSEGDITLHYREYSALKEDPNNPTGPKIPVTFAATDDTYPNQPIMVAKTFVLKMTGNTVNLFENEPTSEYTNALASQDTLVGDDKLYIKGGEGSVAFIDLFGPDEDGDKVADQLKIIRENNWLINEANLSFVVDSEKMNVNVPGIVPAQKVAEPQRVYLYDVNNKRPLIDYFSDNSTSPGLPKFNKYVHDGFIKREETANGRGIKYKIRITNHIRNLVKYTDSTNVRLGLVVTEAIENNQNSWLKPDPTQPNRPFDRVPQASVLNPLGTVLFGTGANVPAEKRVKLEIYYTKPN